MNPLNTIHDAKRLIGRKFSDPYVQSDIKLWPFTVIKDSSNKPKIHVDYNNEKKEFHAEEISGMILRAMINRLKIIARVIKCSVPNKW